MTAEARNGARICGPAPAMLMTPMSRAASSELGRTRVTSAVSTAMKHPNARPLSALKASIPVQVGLATGTAITRPASTAETPTKSFLRFHRSESTPPMTVERAMAAMDTGVRIAIAAVGVRSAGSVMWSVRM
jgi:hypothetical protein